MRKSLLLLSAAAVGLALPAMAQEATTMSPASPNAQQAMPQPSNSVPVGAGTGAQALPGDVNTAPTGTAASSDQGEMTGMQPMRHPHHHRMGMTHHHPMNRHAGETTAATGAGPGEPESRHASNIDHTNTHSDIAPALPMPPVRGNTPEAYLAAADRALARRQSGEAQEALERAETRMLDRSVPMGENNMPMQDSRLTQIRDARMAIANRDYSAARNNIQQAMNARMDSGQMSPPGAMPAGMQPGMAQPGMAPAMQPGMGQGSGGMTPGMMTPGMQPPAPPLPPGTSAPQ